MRLRVSFIAAMWTFGLWLAAPVWADPFVFSTGNPDGRLGALTQPASPGKIQTEAADDFVLTEATVINRATITGIIRPLGTPLASITAVEVEVYHVFPLDSDLSRCLDNVVMCSTVNVPTRMNSPADVEIDAATRDSSDETLSFAPRSLTGSFTVLNTVVNGINKKPNQRTGGEGPATGEDVEISITFTPPIFLPAGHYFFRPEVRVTGGDFLYLSAPRPIVPPGTPFPVGTTDLQAWIRNDNLLPDWLRIGTDIIGGTTPPTFNLTFAVQGETIPEAGTPGQPNCHGKTVSALARQFGGLDHASVILGFSSVNALQDVIRLFCLDDPRENDQAKQDIISFARAHALGAEVPGWFALGIPNFGGSFDLYWDLVSAGAGQYVVVFQITYRADPRFRFIATVPWGGAQVSPWTPAQ